MAVRKNAGSPYYGYRFQLGGRPYHGPTGCTSRREAEAVESAVRDKARADLKAGVSGVAGLTVNTAANRYYQEVGRHRQDAQTIITDLARVADFLGHDTLLTDLTTDHLTRLIAWRRGQRAIKGGEPGKALVSAATVNRSTVQRLQALFTYAKEHWDARFANEPKWKGKKLKEPPERVRELRGDESERIDAALRDDYAPVFEYVRLSGQRMRECLLRWENVDWEGRLIRIAGKGGRETTVPITKAIREILWPLRGDHPEFVFTYVARHPRPDAGVARGDRCPITLNGVKTTWRRLRKRAKVVGFRFHDFRHDYATKMLRATGNLKVVQKALNHADIKTTARYAHVLQDDVAAAAATVQKPRQKLAGKLAGRGKVGG